MRTNVVHAVSTLFSLAFLLVLLLPPNIIRLLPNDEKIFICLGFAGVLSLVAIAWKP